MNHIGYAIEVLIESWIIMFCVFVPLGIWKIIDILIWIIKHITIT